MNLSSFSHTALRPLRPLGLEPGRALANARPTPEQVHARRQEQLRYIVASCRREAVADSERAAGG